MKVKTAKRLAKSLFFLSILLILFAPLYMYFSHDVAALNREYPHVVKSDESHIEFEIKEGKPKTWVSLPEISKYVKWSIVFSEDWAFYQHEGLDIEQIKVALSEMVEERRFRGASTITQQMVKNVFLSEDRTLWRKLHEMILSQKVEKVLSKDKILEVYLNCIEYGPNIYGIRAASYHYFKKHPSALGPREGAFLAMLLPSPKRYYMSFKKRQLTPFAQGRVRTILKKLRMGKVINPGQYQNEISRRFSWERG